MEKTKKVLKMDEHVMEALGKAKIIIRDGKVVEVEEPQV